jgi:hypothetical protein
MVRKSLQQIGKNLLSATDLDLPFIGGQRKV